jgi:O-antigen/teichoic acid export membrane protein
MKDSLYRNSIYLMLSTAVMGGFGFVFWIIAARLFTTAQVGLGSALIASINLITGLSLLGLNMGLIRFLPSSLEKNEKINTVIVVTSLVTLFVSTIFVYWINIFSPSMIVLKHNLYYAVFFIIAMIIMTVSIVIDSVFTAYRSTNYVLLKSVLFSVGKLIFPFVLISLGAFGIFGTWIFSTILAVVVSLYFLIRRFHFRITYQYDMGIIKKIFHFSFTNYLAAFAGALPTYLLPLIIASKLGLESTAHYYIAMSLATMLFMVPGAATQSLFAEGSHNEGGMKHHLRKTIKIILLIMIPAILILFFFGNYILLLFGKSYSSEGFRFLQILAVSGIFVSINAIYTAIFRVKKKVKQMLVISAIGTAVTLVLTYLLLYLGLIGIGIAWIVGQVIMSLIYFVISVINKKY